MGPSALLPAAVMVSTAVVAAVLARRLWVDRPPRRVVFAPLSPRDLLAAAVVWFSLLNLIGGAFRAASGRRDSLGVPDVIALVVAHVLFLAIMAGYVRARYGASVSDLGFRRARTGDLVFALLLYVASLPGWWAASALTRLLSGELPVQRSVELLRESTPTESSLLALAAVVTAPVAEELFFRGIVFGALRGAVGFGPALLFSSLAFGLLHSDAAAAPLVWLGAVLAVVYHRTGSLWAPVAVHAAHNGLMMLLIRAARPDGAMGAALD